MQTTERDLMLETDEQQDEQDEPWLKMDSLNTFLIQAKSELYVYGLCRTAGTPHRFSGNPVWMLGHRHDLRSLDKEECRRFVCSVKHDVFSRVWITYRKDFPNLFDTNINSDAGWGCMLRTTQMMLAQALITHFYSREWRMDQESSSNPEDNYLEILRWFTDRPGSRYPFSIHNMLVAGQCFGKSVGTWYGPSETSHMIAQCVNESMLQSRLCAVVCTEGALYKDQIEKSCGVGGEPDAFKSVIILLPLRLGLDELNTKYLQSLRDCFMFPQSLGVVGGQPQRSLYFLGHQKTKDDWMLLYMDPHTVFPTPDPDMMEMYHTIFHHTSVCSLPSIELDPSISIGFYCHDRADLEDFWERARNLSSETGAMFHVADTQPVYTDWDVPNSMESSMELENVVSGSPDTDGVPSDIDIEDEFILM